MCKTLKETQLDDTTVFLLSLLLSFFLSLFFLLHFFFLLFLRQCLILWPRTASDFSLCSFLQPLKCWIIGVQLSSTYFWLYKLHLLTCRGVASHSAHGNGAPVAFRGQVMELIFLLDHVCGSRGWNSVVTFGGGSLCLLNHFTGQKKTEPWMGKSRCQEQAAGL